MGKGARPRRLCLRERLESMTSQRLKELGFLAIPGNPVAQRISHASKTDRLVSNPVAQCHQAPALDITTPREKSGVQRTLIRFTGFRVRLLDPDNFAGSIKDLLDGLRHAKLIPGDEPDKITLETEQVKVFSRDQERTEIEIISPCPSL
jgi:hypothetical protein